MLRGAAPALALLLGGCEILPDWIGAAEAPPLPGDRISVLALERVPQPDPRIADLQVRLPRPVLNRDWPQVGGYPDHAMHHIDAPGPLEPVWRADIGKGNSNSRQLLTPPIVAGGRVYAVDASGAVSAFDAASGASIWAYRMLPDEEKSDAFGGGIAYGQGRLYVTTGVGEVVALDAAQGGEYWRVSVGSPVRTAPTLSDGRLFVVTYDNRLYALDAADGRQLWSHSGIEERARLLGAASPAAASGIVVVAFSSGELLALRADNGRVAWGDALAFGTAAGALASLGDIRGSPVIDRGRVYAVSHAGHFVAIDLRTGSRLWEKDFSGVQTPWVAGNFLYVLTTEGDILCLSREGRIRWVRVLPRYEKPKKKERPIFWSGPILVSDRLIVVGSHGEALSVSPYTGAVLGRIELPGAVEIAPVAAGGTVYIVTNDGELVALR